MKEKIETSKDEKADKDGTNLEEEEESIITKEGESTTEPTSWKLLDIKAMKVNELRSELDARCLNSKGLKAQLVARLQEAIQNEQEEETCKNKEDKETLMETPCSDKKEVSEINDKGVDQSETSGINETSVEKTCEEPEVMEIDRKTKPCEKISSNDDEIFVKPQPAMDDKQKQALTTAYKLPGIHCKHQ